MKFEYTTTYFAIDYEYFGNADDGGQGRREPSVEEFVKDDEFFNLMNEMGQTGWELVTVQGVLRGEFSRKINFGVDCSAGYGYGYSVTDGLLLFWKRALAA